MPLKKKEIKPQNNNKKQKNKIMYKLLANELHVGDIIKINRKDEKVKECYGKVTEKLGAYVPPTNEDIKKEKIDLLPIVATMVDSINYTEKGYYYDCFKLSDNEKYELIWREREETKKHEEKNK